MKKGLVITLIVVLVLVLGFFGYNSLLKPMLSTAKAVKISVYGVPNDWRDGGTALENAFMKQNPNITVEDIPYVADSLTFIKTRAAANDLPDITEINNDEAGLRLASEGKMMDLKDLECVKHVSQRLINDYTLPDGTVFGIPQGFSTSFIFYNKDIFNEVGISALPTDFDEFIAVCQKIKDKGITPMSIPANDPVSGGFPYDFLVANLLGEKLGLGGYEKALKEGSLDLTVPEGIEVFKKVQMLSKYFPIGVTSCTETMAHDLFAQRKVAMVFAG